MFGFGKKEETKTADLKSTYHDAAINFFNGELMGMNGSGALVWLRGALELAKELDILNADEIAEIDRKGKAKYEANMKAYREEKERILAEKKAERAAKAKAAKGE